MPVQPKYWEAMSLLVEIEEKTGELYRRYAQLYPEHAEFWLSMAREEDVHARWVRHLVGQMSTGSITFQDGRMAPDLYHTFLDYLKQRMHEANTLAMTLVEALSIACDIESAFVERNFFEVFEGDSPEVRTTLRRLAGSSEEHLQRARDYRLTQRAIQRHAGQA